MEREAVVGNREGGSGGGCLLHREFSDSRFRLDFTVGAQHYAGTFRILNRRIDLVASI